MTQPAAAVGREELLSPAEETFNKMAERLLNEEAEPVEDDEEEELQDGEDSTGEEELALEEDNEEQAAETGIAPPVSLTNEEKEIFKSLPEEAKAFTARRIGELERAFSAKAREVAGVQEAAQLEYLRVSQHVQQEAAAQLNYYAEQLKPRVPDARLARTDPSAYAHMLSEYHEKNAQREQAQRAADMANQQALAYQADLDQRKFNTQRARLEAELPELFDPATGQENVKTLLATAEALGIDPSIINDVDSVKALKVTAEWRTKAEKYERATSKMKERVSRKPTPTAKPGPPQGAVSKGRKVDSAWKLVKTARVGADRDAATAMWLEQAGFI